MTARVLVVDDIPANVKLLESRLTAEYFEVLTATSGPEALAICERDLPDIVLLDVMMPGMDGFEVARRMKSNPRLTHIPIIMVTALDQIADRVKGLEAGADDFLTKPVSDVALVARVRSLVRLKMLTDELRLRSQTGREIGIDEPFDLGALEGTQKGKLLLVDDRRSSAERMKSVLGVVHDVSIEPDAQQALFLAAEKDWDLIVVSLGLADYDGLRLVAQLRSLERTRALPILLLAEAEDTARLMRGLDMGANDYLVRPVDRQEMLARVKTQIRRKRYTDHLRDNVQQSIEMAVTDPLTGLNNRRYMGIHLHALVDQAHQRSKPLSALIVDIDFFKSINDTWGHDAGDEVLREFSERLRASVRGIDLVCRYGGEEFVVVMPDTDMALAYMVAERLRKGVADKPFTIARGTNEIEVTISVGLGTLEAATDTGDDILKRADLALYRAKRSGRNRVVSEAA
ncbi:PleD family two-component system response regulator [Methyloraptor flagellatus]|uniref:diguanylate cyclase n=1 Tax=Methyloraptor flagellatus TaxID=3162530 RepID=A0AAU7XFM8_9HYPH